MAALKKGSKGKEVEALQTRLNRLGAKPNLEPDGIFGPITHKAVVSFQKTAKLKTTNGVVDKYTQAALKMGGPLPKMNVKDLSPLVKMSKDFQKHNLLMIGYMSALDAATGNLDKILDAKLPVAVKMAAENKPIWAELVKMGMDVSAKQKAFDALRLSDPVKAEKVSAECDKLWIKMQSNGEAVSGNLDTVYSSLDQTIKDLNKSVTDIQKMMMHLKKHTQKSTKFL